MSPQERKGYDLRQQAEKEMKKMFGRDIDTAQELYQRAATQYKLGKLPDEAAECYYSMARLRLADDDQNGAAGAYVDAGETLELGSNPEGAVNAINEAVEIYKETGKFDRAGKQLLKIADLFENKLHESGKALQAFSDAFDVYSLDPHGTSSLRKCKENMAMLNAKVGNLDKAAEQFVELGTMCTEKNITKFHAKGFYMKAIFCHLARGDSVGASEGMDEASSRDYTFETSSEGKFTTAVVKAFNEKDAEMFQSQLRSRNEVKPFDEWHTSILLKILKQIKPEETEEEVFDDLADDSAAGGDAKGDGLDDPGPDEL